MEYYDALGYHLVKVLAFVAGERFGASDCDYADLRWENEWASIGTAADCSNVTHTNSAICKIRAAELGLLSQFFEPDKFLLHLEQRQILHIFDIWNREPVTGIDGNCDIVVIVQSILEGSLSIVGTVKNGEVQ